jgi:hypothetical protein
MTGSRLKARTWECHCCENSGRGVPPGEALAHVRYVLPDGSVHVRLEVVPGCQNHVVRQSVS